MDIKDLDKKQLILLTLLITFVVSIATGIITVSLMNQMPKSVPQTINNVIQRTIERVTTVETPAKSVTIAPTKEVKEVAPLLGDGDTVVSIYPIDAKIIVADSNAVIPVIPNTTGTTVDSTGTVIVPTTPATTDTTNALGQGIIISDVGLVLVDSTILNDSLIYKVVLNKIDFDATVLKKFGNGFTILKLSEKKDSTTNKAETDTTKATQ